MGKLDELHRTGASAAAESMGAGIPLIHRESVPGPAQSPPVCKVSPRPKMQPQSPLPRLCPTPTSHARSSTRRGSGAWLSR